MTAFCKVNALLIFWKYILRKLGHLFKLAFLKIFLINLEECSLVFSFLWYLFYLHAISACLRVSDDVNDFMELLKLLQRKLLKILVFSFKTFIEISELCDALFTRSFKISFSIFFWSTLAKLKLSLSFHLLWIAIMLGWFLYFKTTFKVASLVLLTKGSSFEYHEISRFCTILEKKVI